jgi:hypothetical protein
VKADSGNGAHLLYRIELPNDEAATALVKSCLSVLDALFSDPVVSVDAANFNAARIWKLYGTTSKKGDNTTERPHRKSALLSVPEEIRVVSVDLLKALAHSLPAEPPKSGNQPKGQGLNLRTWLTGHGIGIAAEKPWQSGTLFVLDECPFSGSHRDGAFAVQFANGAVFAGCHHASCGGGSQRWQELRERYEPRESRTKTGKRREPSRSSSPSAGTARKRGG